MKRAILLAAFAVGCASSVARPSVLVKVDDVRGMPAVRDAERRAPQAYAHAEALRARAERANRAGDSASAQILAEHALAAYERAVVLARLTTAEVRRGEAEARLATAEKKLAALDEQQKRVLAETEQLELRTHVLRDTMPLPQNAPAAPERERARLQAARALALQARLLCASARLLEPQRPTLPALFTELEGVEGRIAKGALPAPIDDATRLRSRCLAELSQIRRPKTLAAPASGVTDALLEQLSAAEYEPVRDERGVVVTLRGAFAAAATLDDAAAKKLSALARVAQNYPDFPVLVVLHSAGPAPSAREAERLRVTTEALQTGGAKRVDSAVAGDAAPAVDPKRAGARDRNERIEIVFVAPNSA